MYRILKVCSRLCIVFPEFKVLSTESTKWWILPAQKYVTELVSESLHAWPSAPHTLFISNLIKIIKSKPFYLYTKECPSIELEKGGFWRNFTSETSTFRQEFAFIPSEIRKEIIGNSTLFFCAGLWWIRSGFKSWVVNGICNRPLGIFFILTGFYVIIWISLIVYIGFQRNSIEFQGHPIM